jgi:hypothetical protein
VPRGRRRVDVEHREVGRGVDADDGGVVGLAVREPDLGGVGALDDVGVRDHVTGVVDDEARALRLGRARSRRALRLRLGGHRDLDGGRVRPLVDLADRQSAVLHGLRARAGRGAHDRGGAVVVERRIRGGAGTGGDDKGRGAGEDLVIDGSSSPFRKVWGQWHPPLWAGSVSRL